MMYFKIDDISMIFEISEVLTYIKKHDNNLIPQNDFLCKHDVLPFQQHYCFLVQQSKMTAEKNRKVNWLNKHGFQICICKPRLEIGVKVYDVFLRFE